MTCTLTGAEQDTLCDMLCNVADLPEAARWFFAATDVQLYDYVSQNQGRHATMEQMLRILVQRGKLAAFLARALQERPGRPDFRALVENLCSDALRRAEPIPARAVQEKDQPVADHPAASSEVAFERLVRERVPQLDIEVWLARLGALHRQVCRIEVDGKPAGTGFLIGPDVVLTSFHVVSEVLDRKSPRIVCRFDYMVGPDNIMRPGTPVNLAPEGILASSPYSPSEGDPKRPYQAPYATQLDYTLLRIDGAIGGEPSRGWLRLPDHPRVPPIDTPMVIVHHIMGHEMKLAFDTQGIRGMNANNTRIHYTANTESGSSGSPCLTLDLEPFAIHQGWSPTEKCNQGVPLWMIRDSIVAAGLNSVLGQ